jgi:hypothetical protein
MEEVESWLPVVDWEGFYEVSDLGRVRSVVDRVRHPAKVLNPWIVGVGYRRVDLRDGRRSSQFVHQLVLEAFVGPCPEGMEVCHNDGDPTNNRLDNLRYGTRTGNMQDRTRHGRNPMLAKTHCPQGHPYVEGNIDWGRTGSRTCSTCRRARKRAYMRRTRADTVTDPGIDLAQARLSVSDCARP